MPMDPDEVYRSAQRAIRIQADARELLDREVKSLRAELDTLRDILVGKDILTEGHKRLLDKVGEHAASKTERLVKLSVLGDKYAFPGSDIDCASLLHLCRARCCTLRHYLGVQDLQEGIVKWDIEAPYTIRREDDGYCTHISRATGGCTIHAHRPATCRQYDCREDRRVWIDFDGKIPAPMPEGVVPIGASP